MATWPHISAKNKTDILPNQEGFHAASEGGAGFTARGSQSMVGRACRTVLAKTPCVESGTHPQNWFPIHPEPPQAKMKPGATVTVLQPFAGHVDLFATRDDGTVMSTFFEVNGGWREWFA